MRPWASAAGGDDGWQPIGWLVAWGSSLSPCRGGVISAGASAAGDATEQDAKLSRVELAKNVVILEESRADLGLAFDGDADRLQLVDAQGRLYNGDELLYVMVADRLAQGQRVPGAVGW
mgnify:CR=1 FL=1